MLTSVSSALVTTLSPFPMLTYLMRHTSLARAFHCVMFTETSTTFYTLLLISTMRT